MKYPLIGFASACVLLTACSAGGPKTIGSLNYEPPLRDEPEPAVVTHEEVRSEYDELAELFEDQAVKEQIERRIADVYMMEGTHDQRQVGVSGSHYVEAIKAYRNILEKYPDSPDNAEVLYQLAKAYDLEGDQDEALAMLTELTRRHPHYPNLAEAHFRMGDILFNQEDYHQAEQSYRSVLAFEESRLQINAQYMLGWALYKQRRFSGALSSFSEVLSSLMGNRVELDGLDEARQPVARDTIHSISLALDKVGGAEVIAALEGLSGRPYVWLIYDDLGEYYREKDLYEKAADSFRQFVTTHADAPQAPGLHSKIIDTYRDGGFPSLVLKEKAAFVSAYGIHSGYAGNAEGLSPSLREPLRQYLDELARYHYNEGETLNQRESDERPELGESGSLAEAADQDTELDDEARAAYEQAAAYYGEYAATFPEDERIDEVIFLRSESLFLAQRYAQAVDGYEQVAYQPQGTSAQEHASNAGYAAILAYQEHIATLTGQASSTAQWQTRAVDSMLRFAGRFHEDPRAVSVLTHASDYLFSLGEYRRALDVSEGLLAQNPQLDSAVKKTVYGIMAHSHFNLEGYDQAAVNYQRQRDLMDPQGDSYPKVTERLATSLYRHAQALEAKGADELQVVEQLLKIKALAPAASLRVPTQYEAATRLIGLTQWDAAIDQLDELNRLFPDHELAVEFPRRLAYAQEQREDWAAAAEQYRLLSEQDPDEQLRQEALFLTAEMYENQGDLTSAIDYFRDYANRYSQPTAPLMEARYRLAINYQKVGDGKRQRFWLDKLVEGASEFDDTDRNRWLGAWANDQYGDYYAESYRQYPLSLPLVESLPEKNRLLERASERYQRSADQGLFEFTTRSGYKIAELYRQLARELRAAPVPTSLSTEDRALYRELIEEQALPFDELARELHQANIDRAWSGEFNQWIDQSFSSMRALDPERFDKTEQIVSYGDAIR